jgi:hypothetical protein
MRKISAIILTLTVALMLFLSACAKEPESVIEIPDFTETMNMISEYEGSYALFMNSKGNTVTRYESEGTTPLGLDCTATYTAAPDGMYKNVAIVATRDGSEMHDEYFALNDDTMFVVRSYISDGTIHIEKYLCDSGVLFSIDEANSTILPVTDVDSLDLYTDFTELETTYAQ